MALLNGSKFVSNGTRMAYYHRIINPSINTSLILNSNLNSILINQKNGLCAEAKSATMELFDKAKTLVSDDLKNQINATMLFVVSGKNFLFEAKKDQPLKIEVVAEPPKVDVTMIAEEAVFLKLVKGEMKPTMAFMSGKLKIKGDLKLAQKAEKLFKTLQKDA